CRVRFRRRPCRGPRSRSGRAGWYCPPPHEHTAGSFRPGWKPRRGGRCPSESRGATWRPWSHSSQTPRRYVTPFRRRVPGGRLAVMTPPRRMFVAAGASGLAATLLGRTQGMSLHLSCGAIGVKASQTEAIDYAARYGFDSVDADGAYLQGLEQLDLARLLDTM